MMDEHKADDAGEIDQSLRPVMSRRTFNAGLATAGAATTVLVTIPAYPQGGADAARNAVQSAVQSAVSAAREEVLTRLELRAGETKRAALISGTVRTVAPPRKGKLSIRRQGKQTAVYYKADKGASGEDSFQYIKVADAGSTENITVAVTIK